MCEVGETILASASWIPTFRTEEKIFFASEFAAYQKYINKEACDAQGGTWCPAKSNCDALKSCIASLTEEADAEKRLAFVKYLQEGPPIEDSEDRHQCGR